MKNPAGGESKPKKKPAGGESKPKKKPAGGESKPKKKPESDSDESSDSDGESDLDEGSDSDAPGDASGSVPPPPNTVEPGPEGDAVDSTAQQPSISGGSNNPGNLSAKAVAAELAPGMTRKVGACECLVGVGMAKCSAKTPTAVAVACDVCRQWVCGSCYAEGGRAQLVFDDSAHEGALFVCNSPATQCMVDFGDFPVFVESSSTWVARATLKRGTPRPAHLGEGMAAVTTVVTHIAAERIDPYSPASVVGFKETHGTKVGAAVASVHSRDRVRKRKFEESQSNRRTRTRSGKDDAREGAGGVNEARTIMEEVVASCAAQMAAAQQRLQEMGNG
jgi:hypothetical protein